MHCIPVVMPALRPPRADLFPILRQALTDLKEDDIVLISSKVVAIHEGRCIPISNADKNKCVRQEADICIDTPYRDTPLTIKHHAFLGSAGIDESNGDGHLVLLPKDPFASAEMLHTFLTTTWGYSRIGVIITDSRSQPFRYGATGIAIGFYGIEPLISHIGKRDLFGRMIRYERSDLVDGLAAAACVVQGEVAESTPIVIARNVPGVIFRNAHLKDELMVPPHDDMFRVLYERFLR